ncbi:thioredoxin family protein [Shewanella acanthi]|uniref:thioredoxin family protein n=1 Tax=Shewanella acanthi TaxID=2864212 RepID=UPI001C65FD81|nr:thioredoxin family protein [Shewanella acanthi]QYJ78395.1 thioredoxin family protein [Shewanella acanthi]
MNTQSIHQIDSMEHLTSLINMHSALLLLFGSQDCGVCQNLKPRIADMLAAEFPLMQMAYIDCTQHSEIAAEYQVFSLPVVECLFEGKSFGRFAKVFSLNDLRSAIERPYSFLPNESIHYE